MEDYGLILQNEMKAGQCSVADDMELVLENSESKLISTGSDWRLV